MVIRTEPAEHWAEPRLVLSPTEVFKAAALGGIFFEECLLRDIWHIQKKNALLRAHLHDAAAFGIHDQLALTPFDHLYRNPSPFIIDEST